MQKINIHLGFDEKSLQLIRELNQRINSIAESEIVFDDYSKQIPHITLMSGLVSDEYLAYILAKLHKLIVLLSEKNY